MQKNVVDVKGAANYLGVSKSHLDKLRTQGGGPRFVRIGRKQVRYRVAALDEWLEGREMGRVDDKPAAV